MNFVRFFGRRLVGGATYLGALVLLVREIGASFIVGQPRWKLVPGHILEIGARSQLVVMVTGAFTGAVFAAQTFFQFHELGMDSAVGPVVAISMCRELGPVLTGLMVAGRVGAAMSSELGTMKVTEQIDALRTLAVHPIDYLVVPRLLAIMASMPLLVGLCIAFGVLSGYFVGVKMLGIQAAYFMSNLLAFTDWSDVFMGLVKGFFFGIVIVVVSCHKGLTAAEGAVGVGRAATSAVVDASLGILILNFFLTLLLSLVFPA
jgi:phospholipid/cholesterol/gamma-HCH transport system permease protein